jgi:flavodoxin
MHQVLFYSKGGNTQKLAGAIAEELGVKATNIKAAPIDPAASIIFLGSGCYGSKPGEEMMKFIEKNDSAAGRSSCLAHPAETLGWRLT